VFMVEQVNERDVTIPGVPCPEHPDGSCGRGQDRIERHFDIRRVDTGEIVVADVAWMHLGKAHAGAMYWQNTTGGDKPAGPDDWTGYSTDELDRVRGAYAERPELYGGPHTQAEGTPPEWHGLPRRQKSYHFTDGDHLVVVCPNGYTWDIDSRASNCTMPYDYNHRCWVRHGDPPKITVDKNGVTCAAGAGSILAGDYHGFLQNGILTAG
jgi:hypothetical protein